MPSVPERPTPDLTDPKYDKLWETSARLWLSAERNGWRPRRSVPSTPLSPAITPLDEADQ